MNLQIYDFEKFKNAPEKKQKNKLSDDQINEKYENGEQRIITEQGAYKLDLLGAIFSKSKYILQPDFQRRITWDTKKRSKLIESFIMNIPVPPVFLYEENFSTYVVMDGLQRISAIIDFYNDVYSLVGLEEWPELNGKKYSQLPQKIKEGIDRRQLSAITLLKESTGDIITADKMKKIVFERLNTGGVQLEDQEIRNALYQGPFNDCCIELSENRLFKRLWRLEGASGKELENNYELDEESSLLAAKNRMIRRMYNVELVLRYFAMRTINNYSGKLSKYLDTYLVHANSYSPEDIGRLKKAFIDCIKQADSLFGDKAFCVFRNDKGWSQPQNMIYDAMMISMSDERIRTFSGQTGIDENVRKLQSFYLSNEEMFNGRKQSRKDILGRVELIIDFLVKEIMR